jgi:hypothetical protein
VNLRHLLHGQFVEVWTLAMGVLHVVVTVGIGASLFVTEPPDWLAPVWCALTALAYGPAILRDLDGNFHT